MPVAATPPRRCPCFVALLNLAVAMAPEAVRHPGGERARAQGATREDMARFVEDMYGHAYESYMTHAFPADELRPLSCDGRRIRERGDLDAVLGNYSLTLIDALDSLVIFSRFDDFESAVEHVGGGGVTFDLDVVVSTFEVNIRLLGGLLSGHMHATRLLEGYNGTLLVKALDLAGRLRPAFDTPTGMPRSRVHLQGGALESPSNAVSIAEAGSFLLEFGVLSLLTGDGSWYSIAKRSLLSFWRRRSALDLVGTVVDVVTGAFSDASSTTGPGQDSFFEYLLKGYVLFDDLELLEMFHISYAAVERYHTFEGFTYNVDMNKGLMAKTHLSPLSSVWGSLQVLLGDVAGGLRTVLYWFGIWKKYQALPDVFDTKTEAPTAAKDSPLRPELAEAIFYLSLALPDDPQLIRMAASLAAALDMQSRVTCGFASVADVVTKRLDDRMDSFFLSETLVYLYLVLAPPELTSQAAHWPLGEVVFSTEGHMFPLPQDNGVYAVRRVPGLAERVRELYPEAERRPLLTCDALQPLERASAEERCRSKYVLTPSHQMHMHGHTSGLCRSQAVSVTAMIGGLPPLVIEGMSASFGPEVAALPPAVGKADVAGEVAGAMPGEPGWPGTFGALGVGLGLSRLDLERPAGQMPPFSAGVAASAGPGSGWLAARELFVTRTVVRASPLDACKPLDAPEEDGSKATKYYEGSVVIVERGSCLFLQKLTHLQRVHAAIVIVINQKDTELQVMSCPLQDRGAAANVHTPSVMVSRQDGLHLLGLMNTYGNVRVRIATAQ